MDERCKTPVVILLEGRDASGKTTTARDIVRAMGRGRVVSVSAPTEEQRRSCGSYFRRWLDPLEQAMASGRDDDDDIIVFDRSWYNRALVERVMGFCTPAEVEGFFEAVPQVERGLVERGARILKFFFEIGEEEQARRLAERRTRGELTAVDAEALVRRDAYGRAEDEMFARTGTTPGAPWIVLPELDRAERLIRVLARLVGVLRKSTEKTNPPISRSMKEE